MLIITLILGLVALTTGKATIANSTAHWSIDRVLSQITSTKATLGFILDVGLPPNSSWPSAKRCVRDWDISSGTTVPMDWAACHTDAWLAWRFLPGVEQHFPTTFVLQVAFWDQRG